MHHIQVNCRTFKIALFHCRIHIEVKRNAGSGTDSGRSYLGWTQEQLADESGIEERTIIKIEKGETNPKFSTIYPLIRVLKIDARVIFNHEQAEAAPTLYQLFEVLKDCSESEAQSIMNMALIFLASSRGENGYTLSRK